MNKYELVVTNTFKKDLKRVEKRGYDISLLNYVVTKLLLGEALDEKYRDHVLTGNWKGFRECHIQPDWLLVYEVSETVLVLSLTRTGSHSDLNLS